MRLRGVTSFMCLCICTRLRFLDNTTAISGLRKRFSATSSDNFVIHLLQDDTNNVTLCI